MPQDPIQMEMRFGEQKDSQFRKALSDGQFHVLIEMPLEYRENGMTHLAGKYLEFLRVLHANTQNFSCSLAFTTEKPFPSGTDEVKTLKALDLPDTENHLLYINGRNRSKGDVRAEIESAVSEGYRNICIVTGNQGPKLSNNRKTEESVCVLKDLKENPIADAFIGSVVNPFNYTPENNSINYLKMVKKVNCGTNFFVSQFGWDMRKNQELRWYLLSRGINVPVIARFKMLSRECIESICSQEKDGKVEHVDLMQTIKSGIDLPKSPTEMFHGVSIPLDFKRMIQGELDLMPQMFEEQQIRRLQIHVAGLRLMGYNGIQIAGVESPALLKRILTAIQHTLQEFNDFNYWRENFNLFYKDVKLAPYPDFFYLYENLMQIRFPDENTVQTNSEIPYWTWTEELRYRIGKSLFRHADEIPASDHALTKRLLFDCKGCDKCTLPQTFYICTENCPLHIANGPCGAPSSNNKCFYDKTRECVFVKQYRIVNDLHEYPTLEENVVEK